MTALMNHRLLAGAVLLTGFAAAAQVPFVAETTPIPTATAGDVAIVWEKGRATPPLVVGCDPLQNGLYVYATDGGLVQVVPYGAMGGVDSRTGLSFGNAPSTLVAASASISQSLVFGAPADGGLADVTAMPFGVPTAAAVTMHASDGGVEVIADDSAGTLRRVSVEDDGTGLVQGVQTGTISLPGVPSALVVDDRSGTLYAAIPAQGVFRVDLAQGTVDPLVTLDAGFFGALIGGVTFYPLYDGGGLLLTTVPPTDEIVVHELNGSTQATYVTRFRVESGTRVVRAPQHVDVVANRLPGFDAGLFVIQDTATANYKLVPWELLATSTAVPLPIEVPEDIGLPRPDAGVDGGTDAGEIIDAGTGDGGTSDGGTGGGSGGSTGPPARPLEPTGCGCTAVDPGLLFPGLLGLVILDAIRRRRTGAA